MATIVPTSEEDPVLAVVRFTSGLAWADAGAEVVELQVTRELFEAQECIVALRWLDLASLMLTSAAIVVPRVSDKDMESIFSVICNLVTRSSNFDEELKMAKLVSEKVAQQPNDRPTLRLKILFNLYNLLENPYSKFFVYTKALDLANNGKVSENIIPTFRKMDSLLQEWKVGEVDQRALFLAISNILKDNKSTPKDSLAFLTKYLATFPIDGEEPNAMNDAKAEAVRAIIEFVKSSDIFQCDLLDMPAVKQLEKDEQYSLVYQLLKIFLTKRLDAYIEFHASNSTLLSDYGLVHEDCVAKMRLMTLVDLSSSTSGEIPYSRIKEALQITEDEVEQWVVKAIITKILDCKLNQMNQTVIVSRHVERVFGPAQWQSIHSKLGVWRANVANAISIIQAR